LNNDHADTAQPDAYVTDSEDAEYGIRIDINDIRPKDPTCFDRICRRGGKTAFIVGRRFDIEYQLTNVSRRKFPGGELILSVSWTSQPTDWYRIDIPPLVDGETTELDKREYSALEPGYGMIFAKGNPYSDFEQFEKPRGERRFTSDLNLFLKDRNLGDTRVHVNTIFAQTPEEFYQLWAMIFAAIGLCYSPIKDIIGLLLSWIS